MIKRKFVTIAKKIPLARTVWYKYVASRNAVFRHMLARTKVEPKTIIFETFNGRSYSDSPRALYEQMIRDKRFNGYYFIWVFRNPEKYHFLEDDPRTELVRYRSRKYYRAYFRAKYWVTNAIIPILLIKRDEQVVLQCWHGTPLKRLRADIIEETEHVLNTRNDFIRRNDIDVSRYDHMLSPSKFASKCFRTAFRLDELDKSDILIETGYPRNDFLFHYDKIEVDRVKKTLGLPRNKKVILYAPTFRDDQHDSTKGYTYKAMVDFEYLRNKLGDEYVILFRAHYYIANKFDFDAYKGFVYNVSDVDEISKLYVISDALITDYSSVFFDYANLKRPILFYMYDRDHYEKKLHGFYLDIDKELPGEIIDDQEVLVDRLLNIDTYLNDNKEKYAAFNKKFNYLEDGKATFRVIDAVFNKED